LGTVPDVDFEDDLASAALLDERARNSSFDDLLRFHYARRPEASDAAHAAHLSHLEVESAQAERVFSTLGPGAAFLDLGCGLGRWLEAAALRHGVRVGVDASLVQLVLARSYLSERGVEAVLYAAEIERLPFASGVFDAATATDVLEHVADPAVAIQEAARVLAPGGRFYAAAPSRFSLTAEPHVGVWGLGFLPRAWAERYVERRFSVDYRSIRPFSWSRFKGAFQSFEGEARIEPLQPGPAELVGFSAAKRRAAGLYRTLLRIPVVGGLVKRTAPAFEAWARKSGATL